MVLIQLDMRSLTDFRRVNQRAMQAVDSIPQYKAIVTHSPASLQRILSIDTGSWFSCHLLYETLCTAECDSCGFLGEYIYLITCRRVCFICFTEKPDYVPLLRDRVLREFGLQSEHLTRLPYMKSVPGYYSPWNFKCYSRLSLIDHDAVRQASISIHGSSDAMEQDVTEMTPTTRTRERDSRRLGYWNSLDAERYMAIIRAPYLDLRTKSFEWGFHCTASICCYNRPRHWKRRFTQETFEDHIGECGDINKDGNHIERARFT